MDRDTRLAPETVFEVGLAVLGFSLAAGFAALAFGRLLGGAARRRAEAHGAPKPGEVAPARHQHYSSSPR